MASKNAPAPTKPEVGQVVAFRGVTATIVQVLPGRAIKVEAADGRRFVISGLYWVE